MTTEVVTLRTAYGKKFDEAESRGVQARRLDALALGVGLWAIFVTSDLSIALAIISFALLISSWYLKLASSSAKQVAEEGRRAYLLMDALGYKLRGKRRTDLLEKLGHPSLQEEAEGGEPFFASAAEIGPTRALQNTQESAFYTRHHAGNSVMAEHVKTGAVALVAFVILLSCIFIDSQDTRLKGAQCAILFIAAMITCDSISRSISFAQAKNEAALIDERLENESLDLLSSNEKTALVAMVLGDYSALVAGMPVLSSKRHHQDKDRLSLILNQRREDEPASNSERP